jgi:enoyl-CoA hydratase/carnithine racemase
MADLLVDKAGHTTILTINRPERMNAMGGTVDADLTAAVAEFQADPDQFVAVITGAGDKAFCAGADLKEMAAGAASGTRAPVARIPDIAGIAACEKVTIAAVNGLAIAGGLELSICCDIRIASENAWFGVFEVKHGILAGVASSVLPRLMPMGAVMDLMLTGARLTAGEALNFGLVQKVVPHDQLMERVLEKAEMVAQNSQAAVWGTKQVIKFWRDALLADQQRYYEAVMQRVLLSGDFLEGPRAFSEKREPVFSKGWPSPFRARG